jgi:hypothetical protein
MGLLMRIYVKTRGTSVDYRFLGPVPRRRWWEPLSGRYLVEEKPAVAVSGEGPGWSAAMFGIASRRRDSRLRAIRYSLLIEAGPAESDLAVRCVRLVLNEGAREELGARLDEIYPADLVDAALETALQTELPDADLVLKAVRETAAALPATAPASSAAAPWIGSGFDAQAVDAFLAHTQRLARGQRGLCFTSRGLSTIEQARTAVAAVADSAQGELGVCVLALDTHFYGVQSLRGNQPARRAPVWTAVSMAVAVTVLVLIVWVLRQT